MHDFLPRLATSFLLAGAGSTLLICCSSAHISLLLWSMLWYLLIVEWPQFQRPALTPLYPVLPLLMIIALNNSPYRSELLWLLVIICAHDTGAYLVGNLWGFHKICPAISPGKSWEGLLGGLLISLFASFCFVYLFAVPSIFTRLPWYTQTALVVCLNIAGVVGDLFESFLKRSVHIKDSGTLLPGHGGLLDRLDSLTWAAPVWMLIRWLLTSSPLLPS